MPVEMTLPWVESPLFSDLLPEMCADDDERELATRFHQQGYLVFEKLIPAELVDRVITEVAPLFDPEVRDGPPWAANLVHGGGPVLRPGSSRWSQVTHYYFEDCLYYTPMLSNWVTGDVYLRKIVDIATGESVPNVYRGVEIDGVEEAGTFKLLLDQRDGRETVRALDNEHLTHLKRLIDGIEGSWSYKLGRGLTAPLRWLRRRVG